MLILLLATLVAQTPPDSVVARVRATITPFADTAGARAAGFAPLGGRRFQDGTPFQGIHWISLRRFLASDGANLAEPSFLMYAPSPTGLRLVGAAYSRRIGHEEAPPEGIGGAAAEWHLHQACFSIPGIGLALADGTEDCLVRGGKPTPKQTAMVHVWLQPNPDGPFGHDNVELPFNALGIDPAIVDHQLVRPLGVALGEVVGFRLPYVKRLDVITEGNALRSPIDRHRLSLASVAEALRTCRPGACQAIAEEAVAHGDSLRSLYDRLAPTAEFREQMDRQFEAAVRGPEHHHGH